MELHEYNKLAQACSNHRLIMQSSERVLVNERYDDNTESPANVAKYITVLACPVCSGSRTIIKINH